MNKLTCQLWVPEESLETYRHADHWNTFLKRSGLGELSVFPASAPLFAEKTLQLQVIVFNDKTISWESDNEDVATVSSTGLVTSLSAGEATISASINDGAHIADATITVYALCDDYTAAGYAGTLAWMLCTDGTLNIVGKSTMPDYYTASNMPWLLHNTDITAVNIGEGVTSIGWCAFRGCSELTSITIPESVTSIGNNAFEGCTGLTSIAIPEGVTSIGGYAFHDCSGLTSINIPEGVTSIGNFAFYGCSGLTSPITIPEGVTTIEDGTFSYCIGLTSIIIPASVTTIGTYAFEYCSSLTEVINLATTPQTINTNVFSYVDKNACTLRVPAESVGLYHAADVWEDFGALKIAGSDSRCDNPIDEGITETLVWELCPDGTLAIYGKRSMPDYDYNFNNGTANTPWFVHRSNITSVEIGEGVTRVGIYAFYYYTGMSSIQLPVTLTSIGRSAFSRCIKLSTVAIPASVTSIETSAFNYCTGLTKIVNMAATPQTITEYDFGDVNKSTCRLLVPEGSLDAYSNADYWKDFLNKAECNIDVLSATASLFAGQIKQLDAISFGGEPITWSSDNPTVATVDRATGLVTALAAGTAIITASINDGAERANVTITVYAFCDDYTANGTEEALFWALCPDGTLQIAGTMPNYSSGGAPWYAYRNNITSVAIGEGVTRIGDYAFYQCRNMNSIQLPTTLTSIGTEAFWYCSKLSTVVIPASVTSIENYAFETCTGLTEVVNMATTPQTINSNTFSGVNKSTCRLWVPEGSLNAYRNATGWKDFLLIDVNIPVSSIELNKSALELNVGEEATLEITVNPATASNKTVTFNSSNPAVATVGETTGMVTAVSDGEAIITVTTNDGGFTATCTVIVIEPLPAITAVSVSPATATVQKGKTQRFTANVTAMGGASEEVTWSVSGNTLAATNINATGLLTVVAGETATALTVTATSDFDNTKTGTASVTVTSTPVTPSVASVTVTPATATVQKGKTQQFTANVIALGGASTAVTWSVTGKTSATTGISTTGLLTVSANETATALTVTATSDFDNTKTGTASVTVTSTPVTPSVASVTVTPATATMQKGKTQQFTANVIALGGASTAVTWSVTGKTSATTGINATGLLTVAAGETATVLTVTATSVFDNTKKGTASITLTAAPSVTSVTVTPATATVQKGKTQQFTANVTAMGGASEAITWSVSGNKLVGTRINATGLLTVSAGETATTLTVTATSDFDNTKSGTASVTATFPITSVTVTPATASVQKGKVQLFTANVTAVGGVSKAVTWSVSDNAHAGTHVNGWGLLTVAAGETATTLTITATSEFDNTKTGEASVTVTTEPVIPSVTSVTVTPATVQKGNTQRFTANVTAMGGASEAITCSVSGNTLAGTYVDATGLLTIAAGETATALTITATSEFDNTKTGEASVMVESVTGTPELDVPKLKVYPNPFTGTVHLTGAESCTLRVINAAGTTVHIQNIESPNETIPLEQLPAGMYFFRIEKDGRAKTVKAIKN